jgi:hypothetical protein
LLLDQQGHCHVAQLYDLLHQLNSAAKIQARYNIAEAQDQLDYLPKVQAQCGIGETQDRHSMAAATVIVDV